MLANLHLPECRRLWMCDCPPTAPVPVVQPLDAIKRKLGDCHDRVLRGLLIKVRDVLPVELPEFMLPWSNKAGFSLVDRTVLIRWDGRWTLWQHKDNK